MPRTKLSVTNLDQHLLVQEALDHELGCSPFDKLEDERKSDVLIYMHDMYALNKVGVELPGIDIELLEAISFVA